MKLCVYQGTFNPIHNAHIEVAKFVHSNFDFDKIIFIPAFRPPHKTNFVYDDASATHRLNMLNLALEPFPFFESSEIEYKRNAPSYTYCTIKELYTLYKITGKINFIIGTDAFQHIESWHQADKLKELVDFILFVRENQFEELPFKRLYERGYSYKLTHMPYLEISSSSIREKVRNRATISDDVPLEVERYIQENELYRI